MPHDIKPLSEHAVINVQLAIHSTDPDEIADGMNEFLRPEIGEGWIADYSLLNTDTPSIIMSEVQPVEGELFDKLKTFTVCVQDSDHNIDWVSIDTELDLLAMEEPELRKVLSSKIVIGQEDRVFVGQLNQMQRITLTADDKLFPFHVSLYEEKGDKHTIDFFCMAECEDHADEQALNAYPNGEVRHTVEIDPEDYPYDIN